MSMLTDTEIERSVRSLPNLPQVVMELVRSLCNDESDLGQIIDLVSRDPVIAAKTLRMANSSFYGMPRAVNSIDQAVTVLGFHTVRNIATTVGFIRGVGAVSDGAVDLIPFWRHSLLTALVARELASIANVSPGLAYTCGLLHDVGKLVLMAQFPLHGPSPITRAAYLVAGFELSAERAMIGVDHASVGGRIAHHWQFPQEIQDAVACHHSGVGDRAVLPLVVAAANAVAHAMDTSRQAENCFSCVPPVVWECLQIGEDQLTQILGRVEENFDSIESLLR